MDKCKKTEIKKTSIGGQAVMEGVMMRGESSMATAVRDEDGVIRIETKRVKPARKRNLFLRLPIIRGVYSFIQSMVGGVSVLMRSAEVFGEGEPSKFEKWLAEKLKVNIMGVVTTISLVLALVLSIFLFIFLPQEVRILIEKIFKINSTPLGKNLIEGITKVLIFVGYIILCSCVKEVKRTFMYHGAEHKTISCYEEGLELTISNAKKCSRVHNRCGTTFLVFVMLISILVFAIVESFIGNGLGRFARIGLKILFLPIVAGLSYELLKGLAKTDCFIFYPLKLPGLLLQRLTTKEPDDKMLEVAITAFNKVLEMDNDQSIQECAFEMPMSLKEFTNVVIGRLSSVGIEEVAEAEWIVSIALSIKRDQVYTDKLVSVKEQRKVNSIVNERMTGRPLWYCIGDTDFYGYKIIVNESVLIPRPETELLVENAIKEIKQDYRVLDMCTGSGAIAIAVYKQTNALVTAVDISPKALEIAKENAKINNADINFIQSDLFNDLSQEKFDVIISNPPYIRSADIYSLQNEVKNFEPLIALDGGEDGLDFYRRIADNSKDFLKPSGILLLECGYNQAEEVAKLLTDFSSVSIIKDYENIDRIIKAVR